MSNLSERLRKLETEMGGGKAWLIEHNNYRTIVSDVHLKSINPLWGIGAVQWNGSVPDDGVDGLAERLRAARLKRLVQSSGVGAEAVN